MIALGNIRSIGDLYNTYLMPETPIHFFIIIFLICISYIISKGIEVLARLALICTTIVFFVIISTIILLIPNIDFSNLMPISDLSPIKYLQGINISVSIFFGEIFLISTIIPYVENDKHIKGSILWGMFGGFLSLLLVQIRNTAVEGDLEPILLRSSFDVIRLIDIANIFTRIDVLIIVAQTITILFKSSILFYVLIISIAQLLELKNYLSVIIPIGSILALFSIIIIPSSVSFDKYINTFILYVIPFIFIIPSITYLLAVIQGLPKKIQKTNL